MLFVYLALECAYRWDVAGGSYWQCAYVHVVPVVDHQVYEF